MGKFFNERIKKDRASLIKYGLIGAGALIILILLIIVIINRAKPKVSVVPKDDIRIEVNSGTPEVSDLLTVKNYDESKIEIDWKDFDISKVGYYTIYVTIPKVTEGDLNVQVVDTTPPVFKAKDLSIGVNEEYSAQSFVETCEDNSKEECIFSFYDASQDQNGERLDYSNFTEQGTYSIKVVASDSSGNTSEAQEVQLVIGEGGSISGTCQYGGLEIDDRVYNRPATVIVADKTTGCALNKDLWDDNTTQKPALDFYNANFAKLKVIMQDKLPKENLTIHAYPHFTAVINNTNTGLVGYIVYVKVYAASPDTQISNSDADQQYLIASYYLNSDGTRQYELNKYNLE